VYNSKKCIDGYLISNILPDSAKETFLNIGDASFIYSDISVYLEEK
jgi:hypothetical protein